MIRPPLLFTLSLFALAVTLHSTPDDSPHGPHVVQVNPAITHTVWEGWGTSLCWMGNVFGDRDDVADLLFTTKTTSFLGQSLPGLGLNIVRYNAGACSGNTLAGGRRMQVSKIIKPYRQMDCFWLDPKNTDPDSPSWNWNADAKQRAMLLNARDRGADRFELFSNSPPWWMCANDNPSGADTKADENLERKNYPLFATYLATIARHARDSWGIRFTSVEPFNEGTSNNWFADCKQEGTRFNPDSQAAFLPILRSALDRQGLKDLPVSAADEGHYDEMIKVWTSYPTEVRALVSQVNVHGYQLAKGDRAGLHRMVVKEAGKRLWLSEHGDKFPDGLEMARNIHRDFAALHPSAWCYWQPIDDGSWAMLDADMTAATFRGIHPKYWVFAHYTRHIRPGMNILVVNDAGTIAAYAPAEQRLALVVLNDGPAREIDFDLSAFRRAPDCAVVRITARLTTPKDHARYQELHLTGPKDGHLLVHLAADSIQTMELHGLAPR